MKKFILLIIFCFAVLIPSHVFARTNVTDWYIKDFHEEIVVNSDSTADITEKITADCGDATGKHGIYRVLPTVVYKTAGEKIYTPIELISITNGSGSPVKYSEQIDTTNHTITWKIGDANIEVRGENFYEIKYKVKNIIRFDNPDFDEFYWNINGQFWDLEIDNFVSTITFPDGVSKDTSQVDYYTGSFNSKDKSLAQYSWIDDNTLQFQSTGMLKINDGITVSVTFPKGIFTPYKFTEAEQKAIDKEKASEEAARIFHEKLDSFIHFLNKFVFVWPFIILIICYFIWSKFGKDPKFNSTIVPEFGIPENLSPMEMGTVMTNGSFKNEFMSAAIIHLAVQKIITVEKIEKKGIFGKEDYEIKLIDNKYLENKNLAEGEKTLLKNILDGDKVKKMSSLVNEFYTDIPEISRSVVSPLKMDKLVQPGSKCLMILFITLGLLSVVGSFVLFAISWQIGLSGLIAGVIIFIFAFIMPQRTLEGAKLNQKILGFKLYMETAEKYRQRFNEKENIFEKFLPYAMIFGITGLWVEKMKLIYGEKYFDSYHPVWFVGGMATSFNPTEFTSAMTSMSSNMSSTLSSSPSSSGAGGGGFSGGGGGGGGGGGW